MKQRYAIIFWFLFLAVFLIAAYFFIVKQNFFSILSTNISQTTLGSKPIILMAVGDIMLDRGVKYMVQKYGNGDFNFIFTDIKNELLKADILFGNLEGPISDRGVRVGSIYSFRFSPTSTLALKNAGFDILSLANNHMLDYQAIALQDTMANLQTAGIDYIGAGFNEQEAFGLKIKEIQGVKIGFLGFENLVPANWKAGQDKTGMAWISESDFENIKKIITQSKQLVDILVVSLHAGQEYWQTPDDFQKEFAKMAIDAGADLIIGHHPHVLQPLEKYKQGWIAYSLGNFVFDQYFSKATMESAILRVEIKDKKIDKVVLEKVKLNKYYQPEIAE